jgi:hypothetical protein
VSIESTLTLLVAAAILAVAAVLKLTFYGVMWIASKIAEEELLPWRRRVPVEPPAHALPREPLTVRLGRALQGAAMLFTVAVATIWKWMSAVAFALMIAFAALGAWLEPHVLSLFAWLRASSVTTYRWARPRVVSASSRAKRESIDSLDRIGKWWIDTATPAILETGEATRDVLVPANENEGSMSRFARSSLIVLDDRQRSSVD